MNDKLTISLRIITNSHRANISLGDKANLFASVKFSVNGNVLTMAGFGITLLDRIRQDKDGATIFTIATSDAARLMNKLTRQIHGASLNLATNKIMMKWETRIEFIATDFE